MKLPKKIMNLFPARKRFKDKLYGVDKEHRRGGGVKDVNKRLDKFFSSKGGGVDIKSFWLYR